MPTLKLRFPGGRYHATPWGHHVNEGLIEWPPSPWRLLRALIACGFSSQGWTEIPTIAQQLINTLASVRPLYQLPDASMAHSRHFMPYIEGRNQKTTLVFDTWANVGEGEMLIHWPCELSDEESTLIRQLTNSLGYLGRSESWVEAELMSDSQATADFNVFPHQEGSHPGREYEQVSLMAAIPPSDYQAWQAETIAPVLEAIQMPASSRRPTPKQLEKFQAQRDQAIEPYPPSLLDCLTKDTTWWKGRGWSQPPGSQRVLYWRRSESLQVGVPQRPKSRILKPVTTMLLSLTTPTGNRASLPPCTRTLPQAELFHRAIVGRAGKGRRVHCLELTGKDENDRPLQDQHRHAHTLPVDLDGDGHLDHIIIYAPMGLGDAAQRAIRETRETWRKKGPDLQVAVVGYGSLDILRQLPERLRASIEPLLGPPTGARIWRSVTPFVPPRHLKARGKNALLGQVNAELASRLLPQAEDVHVDPELTRELRHYIRRRNHGGNPPPMNLGLSLQLVFSEPVAGPLLLGYASHYGLGLMAAID